MKLQDFLAQCYGELEHQDIMEIDLCLVDNEICVGTNKYPIGKLTITSEHTALSVAYLRKVKI